MGSRDTAPAMTRCAFFAFCSRLPTTISTVTAS
jgi:hypothetical protein